MRVEYVPVLKILRELYAKPRDMTRFREYVATLMGDGADWPALASIGLANPMAKEHVARRIDELLAAGVEEEGADAARLAAKGLPGSDRLRVSLVIADDVGGGWTDRHLTEANARLAAKKPAQHGWATALAWASEPASRDLARAEVLAACYRAAHALRFGDPTTLREAATQEGRAARFAGVELPLAAGVERALAPHLDDATYATMFAGMYGDDVARKAGHRPLGVPDRAGFALGLAWARAKGDPVRALT